ncbi:hypothetical protein BH11BAC3_BH11BAC3_17080 [soil metagenome]
MSHTLKEISILIIEDSPPDQWLLKDQLSETNLNIVDIVSTVTIKGAIEILHQRDFSLLFLDLHLPDSDGLHSLDALAKINPKVPIIVLSGMKDKGLSLQAISHGAQDFLNKSDYTPQVLEKAVIYSIERKKNRQLIEENNERNEIILKATNDILWDWDLTTGRVKWFGAGLKKYIPENLYPGNIPDDFWVFGLHPDERRKTIVKLKKAIIQGGGSWESDNRFLKNDGHYAYINTRGFVLTNADNKPIRMMGSMQDITDRKNAELEIRKAKNDADDARKTQEQFLANMSHEIRTPMNGVIGMTQLLGATNLNIEQREYVETIKESADNLMVVINDILDLTKIVAGKVTIDSVDYAIADVVKNAIQITRFKAEEKAISLKSVIDKNIHPVLLGDPFRLNQVLVNLIGNAIKFTEEGEVNLHVNLLQEDEDNVSLEFVVQDTGIGIDENKLGLVFEQFTQASSETTRRFGGSGLGLTITRQLIELQGGSINVKSTIGVGSKFTFYLTIKKGNSDLQNSLNKTTAPVRQNALAGIKILLAEDNLINQNVAVKILTIEGAEVVVANNGLEAIEMLRQHQYDVVLMDIQMPQMDGYETTRFIRSKMEAPACNSRIIAITASALISEKERCLSAGMDDYITKPFQAKDLFDKILGQMAESFSPAVSE